MWSQCIPVALLLVVGSACSSPKVRGLLPRGDTYIDELQPDRNFDGADQLVVGDARDWERTSARILLDFDLSSLPEDPRQIRSATLLAFQEQATPPGGYQACDVHRCTSDWEVDLVTWSSNVGFDERIWATAMVEEANLQGWVEWDVTDLVLAEHAGEVPRTGWMIKVAHEGRITARRSHFRNGTYGKSTDKPIRLRIELWPLRWEIDRMAEQEPISTSILGVAPGEEVHLFLSFAGRGETSLDGIDVPVALRAPRLLGECTADERGEAWFDAVAPRGAAGSVVWLQAISGKRSSNVTRLVVDRLP